MGRRRDHCGPLLVIHGVERMIAPRGKRTRPGGPAADQRQVAQQLLPLVQPHRTRSHLRADNTDRHRRVRQSRGRPRDLHLGPLDNNTYLQSGKGSWIYNPISAYRTIESQNKDLAGKIIVDNPLKGPKAQIASIQFTVYGIWNFSKNIDAAKQFLIDYSDDWEGQFKASKGYNNPFLKAHSKKPMPVLGDDPKLTHLQVISNFVQPTSPASQALGREVG